MTVKSKNIKKLKVVSLFSGCGGIDLGFKKAGFRTIIAVDIDRDSCETIKKNKLYCNN